MNTYWQFTRFSIEPKQLNQHLEKRLRGTNHEKLCMPKS